MLEEADAIAAGEKKAATFDDIFGSEGWLCTKYYSVLRLNVTLKR